MRLALKTQNQKQLGQSPYDAVGGKFTVDENGIPIKQSLSEDVSRAAEGDQLRLFEDPQPPVDPVLAKQAEQQAAERFAQEQELAKRKEIDDIFNQRDLQLKINELIDKYSLDNIKKEGIRFKESNKKLLNIYEVIEKERNNKKLSKEDRLPLS